MEQIMKTEKKVNLFWSKYYNAGSMTRYQMVEQLLNNADFFKLIESAKVPSDTKKHCVITLVNSYLEDFAEFILVETNK